MTTNLRPWERRLSIAGGLSLLAFAAARRRMSPGIIMTGVALLGRGASGYCPVTATLSNRASSDDPRVVLAGSGGIKLAESVTIASPPEDLFAFWRDLSHLPSFMRHLERVEVLDSHRSHWTAWGPAGMRVEWDAEIINEIRNELIGWKSLPGADVVSAGSEDPAR